MTPPSPVRSRARHRPELQGLRALAAVLIVVHHVWSGRVSGGVDVFFLLSGFLLTGQLVRAAERGPIALRPLWSRTAVRLLPAALTVLAATLAAAVLVLPEGRRLQTLREIAASALFVQNWQLAADAVDYAARTNTASAVQHFWSLSVQVQVHLALTLLVALVVLVARRAGAALRDRLAVALLGLAAASASCSVALTATDQPLAYFHTLTRVWEFAYGGLLALAVDRIRPTRAQRTALGWTGVAGLLLCGLVLPPGAFPGYAALWPTTCAALVLAAGASGTAWGADRLLAARPVRYVGDLSYALYLWHWPVLVVLPLAAGWERVGAGAGVLVIAVSVVLAAATHHLVERPVARRTAPRTRRALAAGTVLVVLTATGWHAALAARTPDLGDTVPATHPGALALAGLEPAGAAEPLPSMLTVHDDWVRLDAWTCAPLARFPLDVCRQPVEHVPHRRIVVVGDSHAQQLAGALAPAAAQHGWQVIAVVRGACPFSTASETLPADADCVAWTDAAAAEIADLRPDLVVTLASRDVRPGPTEVTPPGFVERWWQLHELGVPVLAVRDNPRFDSSRPDCLARAGRAAPECGVERAAVYGPPPWTGLDVPPTVSFLDLADLLCDGERCPAEIGNVLVYMDDNHLTATYAATLAPAVERHLAALLGA